MQKSKKPRENPKKNKKNRSLEIGSTGKSPGTLVFLFFLVFSRFFGFLHFYFCKSPGILFFFDFFVFFWFSRGFLDFCFCKSPGILCFFCFLVFSRFLKLFFAFFKLFGARNLGQGLVPSEALK